jgi:uncharacterized protein (DUF1810 family)
MLLGARLTCGDGAALQYRSADLITWDYDGVLAQRSPRDTAGTWTGSMWECPQLFALDGTWVLLISILDAGVPQYVAYALGDYDGRRFAARVWGRFGHGDLIYATTAFLDADGRRCVMSWLRERGGAAPAGSPWAGALSLPWVLRVEGDLLVARPHPNLPVGAVVADGRTQRIVDFDLVEMVEDGVSGITVPDRGNAMDLQRFIAAQDGVYADALAELRAGRKRTHWMWFVFPQLAGLGSSATAQRYGIASLDEARAYLDDPVLGPRLRECAAAMLAADGTSATEILGYPDDLKLRSSMTLFARAAGDPAVFQAVLDRYYDGPDTRTLDLLADA